MDNQTANEAIEILVNSLGPMQFDSSNLDVFDALQKFWQMKSDNSSTEASATSSNDVNIVYEFLETLGPPYVCFVTLPGGACFATFQICQTKLEARRSACLIALMNSVYNEHPLRKISQEFISKSVDNAQRDFPNICPLSLQLYKRLLSICLNRTMLEFKQKMTVFQLLQWNGSLKAMRERSCTQEEVIEFYSNFSIDDSMRAQMSLDWIAREQQQPGLIAQQIKLVNDEIEQSRLNGQELRFLKEKRDILLLASYRFDMEVNQQALS